jgi:hypothetical protein
MQDHAHTVQEDVEINPRSVTTPIKQTQGVAAQLN